ncbi:MAG TPA: aromatic ring-hydroxylating dioxygenase subunit alpha, partial [Gemmatimonadales bacterium]|nr:aromatic ring-hydroxylating dioxygenase subunit alpha [Gemmatimonadales bacterium]
MSFVKTVESYRQGARTLPGRYYTSAEVFAEEHERVFARQWICIGRDASLAAPGDYQLVDIAGESLIVLRDQSGERRAYYNVCRHRGTRLCEAPRGRLSETIQCPYHAWTYALDGRLIGAPHMNEVDGFDKKNYPLHRVTLHEWAGFLFVNLDPHAVSAEQWFVPLAGRFDRYNLPRLRTVRRIEYDVRANWKLILQNYNE